jgi:hydrogenase-4 component B
MMPLLGLQMWCVGVLLATVALAVAMGRSKPATSMIYGTTLAVSAVALTNATLQLMSGPASPAVPMLTLPLGLPWLGANFRFDGLAAFFLIVVNLGGAAASLYGLGYGHHESAPNRVLPFFPAFLAGMNLVVLADDAFTFLLCWEFMSLASWALVMARHRESGNARAGYIYLVMASFGTLALLLAFGLLSGTAGSYAFAAIRAAEHSPFSGALVLILLLLGAGSKAGLAPLHVWLPLAHPAAPSHVSALMSAVMTKVAVYAFIRIVFDLLGPPASSWSIVVLLIGGITAVLGILCALMEQDLKRLLAYSTIENVGIIFVGLGLALAFQANGLRLAAGLAFTAALFHVFNHSLFKSLLFFATGAVQSSTGSRDIETLGGLIHRMPFTSFVFLVGAVAISALPPLNGFASEWLLFQAILQSPHLQQWALKITVPAVGALLALAAALAAACFVKAFGISFLGRPRSMAAERADEVDRYSLAAMAVLASLCLLAGILPGIVIDAISPVALSILGERLPEQTSLPWLSILPVAQSGSSYNGLLVLMFVTISALLAVAVIHRFASHALRRAPAWGCGFSDPTPAAQYSGASFAQPLRRVFGMVFAARERVALPPPGDIRSARYSIELHDRIWEGLYAPIGSAVWFAAGRLNRFQFLTIRQYLSLVFLVLVGLLLVLAIWS